MASYKFRYNQATKELHLLLAADSNPVNTINAGTFEHNPGNPKTDQNIFYNYARDAMYKLGVLNMAIVNFKVSTTIAQNQDTIPINREPFPTPPSSKNPDESASASAASAVASDASSDAAAASALAAADSATTAEALAGPTFASQALGEAGTTSGQYFAVNSAGVVSIYLRTGGGSTLQRTIATTAALAVSGGAALVGSTDGASGTLWTTVSGFIARLGANFKSQAAGGVVTPGRNVIIGETGNAIASDIGGGTISGGGRVGFENIIGGSVVNVNTSTPNALASGTNANYSVITGGYDNVASGLASVISGFHNYTTTATTHGTISGGSVQKIVAGDYNTIGGGQVNEITAGDYCTIAGGGSHIINLPVGEDGSTISGGFDHTITARFATVGGGSQNAASGAGSTVSGGRFSTASGVDSVINGGNANTAGGDLSAIGGGNLNVITGAVNGSYSFIGAGLSNTIASGSISRFSAIAGGRSNVINAEYASIFGGRDNSVTAEGGSATGYGAVSNVPGMYSRAGGYFTAPGDAQASYVTLRRQTTDATTTELRAGSTVSGRLLLGNDSVYAFSALVAGRATGSDAGAAYKLGGCLQVTAGGAAVLIGTPTVTVLGESNAAWDCTVAADSINKALQINVTGAAATTINWVADVWLVKVTA